MSPLRTAEGEQSLDFDEIFADYRNGLELPGLFDQLTASIAHQLSGMPLDRHPLALRMRSLVAHLTANRTGSFLAMQQTVLFVRYMIVAMQNSSGEAFSTCIAMSKTLDSRFSELESLLKRRTAMLADGGVEDPFGDDDVENPRGQPSPTSQRRDNPSGQRQDSNRIFAFHQL